MTVDSVIIAGGCTQYIQASNVCWNKPFKARMTELYDQWLREGVHQFTEEGNMKPASKKRIIEFSKECKDEILAFTNFTSLGLISQ